MRIAHLIDNLRVGGAQRLLVTFADALDRTAHEMTVIALGDDAHAPTVEELNAAGVSIDYFPGRRLASPGRAAALTAYARRSEYDVLVTHLFHANVLGAWLRSAAGTPVVPVLHNVATPPGGLRASVWRRAILHGSDAVIACAQAVADAHAGWLDPARVTPLPNPVALPATKSDESLASLRRELMGGRHGALAVSVGTVSPQKAFPDLVEAFARIDQDKHPVFLAIAGRGTPADIADVHEAIAAFDVADRVVMLGQRDDIETLLQAADLYVSSSHWEGLPISVLEAMAAGLPVVVTDVGDNRRIVDDSCGALVPPRRPDALADAVIRLLANPDAARARGRRAREIVIARHDPRQWVRDHLDVYRDAVQRRRAGPP